MAKKTSKGDVRRLMDYYRTYKGLIIEVKQNPELALDLVSTWGKTLGYIAKHSKDIIDLIEVGDIVQYKELFTYERWGAEKGKIYILSLTSENEIEKFRKCVENKEIEFISILTHEMYEQNCYRVGEEK